LGGEAGDLANQQLRANPDWMRYLDPTARFAGGVPFIIRVTNTLNGVVVSRNITPDVATGIGSWSVTEIARAIKTGVRKDGTNLFLFPPHSLFPKMADDDALALAMYLKSLPAVSNVITPRSLPFPVGPLADSEISKLKKAPQSPGLERGKYLTSAVVGCVECHSSHVAGHDLSQWTGGAPGSPLVGQFRLGPDLPLTQSERGLAAWPYPGFAILIAPNLTTLGVGGPDAGVPSSAIQTAIRDGIGWNLDDNGRPDLLAHTMLWQFYGDMSNGDARSIVDVLKRLNYTASYTGPNLVYFGTDWAKAFQFSFGEAPSAADRAAFGK